MTTTAPSTTQDLVAWVRSPERRDQLALSLPEDVSIDQFERLTATALLQRPDLLDADRTSLWFSLLDAAKRGLAPDGRQGVINVYNTKVKVDGKDAWIKKAQFLPMIGGIRDELARYGWALRTTCIYSGDEFAYDVSADRPTHKRAPLGQPRGEIVGAWAQLVRLRDGFRINEVMDKAQIDEVREKAKGGDRLWDTWYDRACEKTVGHRAAKKAPLDPKERERIDLIVATELAPGEAAAALYGPTTSEEGHRSPDDPEPREDEPGPSDPTELEPAETAPAAGEADTTALAATAASYVPPNGKYAEKGHHGPKTLAEILALGDAGEKWIRWALATITAPPEYVAAVTSFARVHAVEAYQEALARKEAQT
jgi:phage RecT family recombinase